MNICSKNYQSSIMDIKPGTVFATPVNGVVTICMAIEPADRETVPAFIAISPGHPSLGGRPGVFNGSLISGSAIIVFPDASIAASPNVDHMQFSHGGSGVPAGALLLFGREYAIAAGISMTKVAAFSCDDGICRQNAYASEAYFTSWEIMIEAPSGEPYVLCEVDVSPRSDSA